MNWAASLQVFVQFMGVLAWTMIVRIAKVTLRTVYWAVVVGSCMAAV